MKTVNVLYIGYESGEGEGEGVGSEGEGVEVHTHRDIEQVNIHCSRQD